MDDLAVQERAREHGEDTISCSACASASSSLWDANDDPAIRRCDDFQSTFCPRPIVRHDYGSYYPYLEQYDAARYRWELAARSRQSRAKLALLKRATGTPGRLPDAGAGPGYFAHAATEAGWDAYALEVSPDAIEGGSIFMRVRFVTDADVADGPMDAVTCFHVLEHLEEPGALLRMLRSKLKSGGLLLVHVPSRESLFRLANWRLKKMMGRLQPRAGCLYYPEHVTGFSPAGLAACVEKAGFVAADVHQVSNGDAEYDPMFLRHYLRDDYGHLRVRVKDMAKLGLTAAIDQVGKSFGRGDWTSGLFRAV